MRPPWMGPPHPKAGQPLPKAEDLATDDEIRAFLAEPSDGTWADAELVELARAALSVPGYSLAREDFTDRIAIRKTSIVK